MPKILTLDLLDPERPSVQIEGKMYEMRIVSDFGIRDVAKMKKISRKVTVTDEEISNTESDEEADNKIVGMIDSIDEFVRMVLPSLPEETLVKLKDSHKIGIMQFFTDQAGTATENQSAS